MLNALLQKLNVTIIGALLSDLLENVGIVSLLVLSPSKPAFIALLTMIFGSFKWAFFLVTIGLVLMGFVKAAMNRFRKQG